MMKKALLKFKSSKKVQALGALALLLAFKKGIASFIVGMALSIMKTSTVACSFMGFHEIEYPEI